MAVRVLSQDDQPGKDTELHLILDNGDYEVFQIIKDKWGFKDEESLVRFALAVLIKAETNSVEIENGQGGKTTLRPTAEIIVKA